MLFKNMYYFWNMSRTGSWPVWWDACTDEKATRRGAGLTAIVQHLTAALSAAFVSRDALKTCHSETRIKAERPRCEITEDTCIETLTARVLTLHAQQIENAQTQADKLQSFGNQRIIRLI